MSLFGLDEMYNELLLEAKSPEEIKKILEYQFVQGKGVPQMVLDKIFEIDPTKKKTYTKWVLMQWGNEKDNIMQSLKDGHLQDMFKYFQERANTGLNLLGMKSFEEAMRVVPRAEKDPIFTPIPENEKDDPKNDFDIVYDSAEWRVVVPNTWQADEKLGEGCKWCTAGAFGNGEYYFESYSRSGPLWINFDKRKSEIGWGNGIEYPYTRYQFCFEHGTRGEMMDSRDNRIKVSEMDIPQDVIDFYTSKNPRYAEILTDDYDEEVAWERYANERYEHTILLKEPVYSQYALRLMPTYNEDDPHVQDDDPYEMYNEDDDHDSIDGVQYPDDTYIYDRCDGYAMVVMKSDGWEGNEEINIYFEDRNGRYGARWTSVNDAKVYETSSNGKFFSDDYFDNFYFVLNSAPNDVITLTKPFYNIVTIDEAHITTVENLPSNYQNGMWVVVEHSEGMYGLMYADPETKQARLVIRGDRPTDTHFVAKKDERGYYIEGQFKNYWLEKLSDGDEGDGKQHLEISYFLDDKSYAIVKYEDNGRRYGLYDLNRKELIIKDAYELEEKYDCVYVSYGDYAILYDYKNRKPLTRPFVNGCDIHQAPLMFSYVDYRTLNSNNERYIYSDVNQKEYGPFRYVGVGINYDNLVIVETLDEPGFRRIFDIDKGDFASEEKFQYISPENRFFCRVQRPNGTYYLFDNLRQRCLCEVDGDYRIVTLYDHGNISLFAFKCSDGGFNIYSPRYGIVLPDKATNISKYGNDINVVPFWNEQGYFFLRVSERECKILPSSQGIPFRNMVAYRLATNSTNNDITIEVTLDIDFRHYAVMYKPGKNEIVDIKDVTNTQWTATGPVEVPVTPETISQIEQMFFPDKAQIAEQFKNIMNRMNDL